MRCLIEIRSWATLGVLAALCAGLRDRVRATGRAKPEGDAIDTSVRAYVHLFCMRVAPTKLRSDLYALLDRVLETGETIEVVRASGTIEIRPKVSARARRVKRKKPSVNRTLVVGSPDDLVHFDWSSHWRPFL